MDVLNIIYKIVGMAVAMGIPTIHEQERQGRLHVKLSCLSEHVRR